MRVLITGGTGVIGRPLASLLVAEGHEVIVLTRDPARAVNRSPGVRAHGWNAQSGVGWAGLIGADTAVINLAGQNPARWPWTAGHRRRVLQSRLDAVAAVADAARRSAYRPAVLLQASAVGYYGDRADETLTEHSPPGSGFRAEVCRQWEAAAADAPALAGVRRVVLRLGIVLSRGGGALPQFRRAARLRVRRFGNGRQWVPWVHEADAIAAIRFLLHGAAASGPYNVSSPNPCRDRELHAALSRVTGRRAIVPLPAPLMRLTLGEMADTVLESQRVIPKRLADAGYRFQFPDIGLALADLTHPPGSSGPAGAEGCGPRRENQWRGSV